MPREDNCRFTDHVRGEMVVEWALEQDHVIQRADGTWARQDSGTLQQVIVQTAFAARTLPEDQAGARLRASGDLIDQLLLAALLGLTLVAGEFLSACRPSPAPDTKIVLSIILPKAPESTSKNSTSSMAGLSGNSSGFIPMM